MIRFKNFLLEDYLLENRVAFLKAQNPTLDTSHDALAKHKDAGDIVDHFAKKADPTPNKAHTQWIVNQYKKQAIRQEDAPQIKSTLNDFAQVKDRLEKKDLNQYKDMGELRDAVSTQKSQAEKAAKAKSAKESAKSEDLKKLYDEDGVTGYKIPNKEVSIKNYGPGGKVESTHWCTAANSGNNMFNHYKGGKYTMHFPNGHVLQFHHQSDQIMDKNDVQIKEGDPRYSEYEPHISKFLKQTKELEGTSSINRFHHFEPHEIDHAINNYTKELHKYGSDAREMRYSSHTEPLEHVAKVAKLNDSQFDSIHKLPHTTDYYGNPEGPSTKLSLNGNLTHDQVGKLMHTTGDTQKLHHEQLAGNPAVKGEHLDTLMNSPHLSDEHIAKLASNPNLQPHHVDRLIQNPNAHHALSQNHAITLSPEHQRAIVRSDAGATGFADRKDLHPDTIDHLVHHGNVDSKSRLLHNNHISLSDEQVKTIHSRSPDSTTISNDIFDSPKTSPEVREHVFSKTLADPSLHHHLRNMVGSKQFTREHLDRVLDAADSQDASGKGGLHTLREKAAKAFKASPAQLDRQVAAISKPESKFDGYELLGNKNLKPDHLKKIFSAVGDNDYRKSSVLEHPSVNGDVLHHVFDTGNNWDKTMALHHPSVQASHFNKALEHGPQLHGAITSSPSAPPSVLSKLSDSPMSFVRQNVASHKNTPNEVLTKLAGDDSDEVSSIAKKRLKIK